MTRDEELAMRGPHAIDALPRDARMAELIAAGDELAVTEPVLMEILVRVADVVAPDLDAASGALRVSPYGFTSVTRRWWRRLPWSFSDHKELAVTSRILGGRVAACMLAVVLAAALVVAAPQQAEAHGKRHWWTYAYPFADSADPLFYSRIEGPRKRFSIGAAATAAWQVRGMEWSGWGSRRAVGKGKARYCSDTCSPWRRARIVLSLPHAFDCAHGVDTSVTDPHSSYRRARVRGFTWIEPGSVHTVPRNAIRC